ncbi:MAG: TetR/AcrR family transcriptional regulator [Ilumatobacteraceae bacterium]
MTDDAHEPRPTGRRKIRSRETRGVRPVIKRPSEGRNEQIVTAAAELFRTNGYVRTSMADIAAAIGILPGSLYHYIDSKEDLLFAVTDRGNRQLIERVESQPLASMSAPDALRLVMRVHIEEIVKNITFAAVSSSDKRELKPAQRAAIDTMQERYQRLIIEAHPTWPGRRGVVLTDRSNARLAHRAGDRQLGGRLVSTGRHAALDGRRDQRPLLEHGRAIARLRSRTPLRRPPALS